jgi:5'-3' exonuclease
VGAALGVASSLLRLVEVEGATHVGVAYDTRIESFRNDLFVGYKTGEGIDPALFAQFPLVEQVTEALGFVTWRMLEFEADDALATAARRWAPDFEQILLCSPDKDLLQCVQGTRVVVYDRMRDKTYDEVGVRAKLGISPESVPDYLALVGDTADGIPGVPRWGARSASQVLERYGHLENIPRDAALWEVKVRGAAALCAELVAREQEVGLYRILATLRTDVPLTEEPVALRWTGPRPDFAAVCRELGAERLWERATALAGAHGAGP